MFGLLRTCLALIVAVGHLYLNVTPAGYYAVFCFYVISGYLMTLIMHESYGFTRPGRTAFLVNRFLRLFPQYWVLALIMLLVMSFLEGDALRDYHGAIYLPRSGLQYFSNASLIYLSWVPANVTPRLSPPTWALTVELFYYLAICAGASKTGLRVAVWVSLSILYVIFSYGIGLDWAYRYYSIAAGSLPFSLGAAIYFVSRIPLSRILPSGWIFALFLFNAAIVTLTSAKINTFQFDLGFYANLGLGTLLVLSLTKGGRVVEISAESDRRMGDYSYPIYLLHWPIGVLIAHYVFEAPVFGLTVSGFVNMVLTLSLTISLSFVLIKFVDRPVQHLRAKMKPIKPGFSPPLVHQSSKLAANQ